MIKENSGLLVIHDSTGRMVFILPKGQKQFIYPLPFGVAKIFIFVELYEKLAFLTALCWTKDKMLR